MDAQEAFDALRETIPKRPELRSKYWPKYKDDDWSTLGPYTGACYIATQVFCQLVPNSEPYCDETRNHFWAQVDDKVFDPTYDQFNFTFPYVEGKKTKFNQFSKRSQELLREMEKITQSLTR